MFVFQATDSSMVEGDCQIQMGRFVSFLQVEYVLIFNFFYSNYNLNFTCKVYLSLQYPACILLKDSRVI